jgi:hypothetical protein
MASRKSLLIEQARQQREQAERCGRLARRIADSLLAQRLQSLARQIAKRAEELEAEAQGADCGAEDDPEFPALERKLASTSRQLESLLGKLEPGAKRER